MKGRKTSVDQIIRTLREIEVLQGQGITPVQTYYKWRKEYGNLNLDKAKKLKALETENARLKKLVADLSLDNSILKEAAEGNF